MATQWECFRCGQTYSHTVKFCPTCDTPQITDPHADYTNDKTWIIVVVGATVIGIVTPFVLYFIK